jgi:hypothetical protein
VVFVKVIVVNVIQQYACRVNVTFSSSVNTDNIITITARCVMLNMKIINLKHNYKFYVIFCMVKPTYVAVGHNLKVMYDVFTGDVYQHK